MSTKDSIIEIQINKVSTLLDGSARVTFDFNSTDSAIVNRLLGLKMSGKELVKVVFIDEVTNGVK